MAREELQAQFDQAAVLRGLSNRPAWHEGVPVSAYFRKHADGTGPDPRALRALFVWCSALFGCSGGRRVVFRQVKKRVGDRVE